MKFIIEVELETLVETDPNLPEEIIREHLVGILKSVSTPPEDEIWIDITDDGDEKFNIYRITDIK